MFYFSVRVCSICEWDSAAAVTDDCDVELVELSGRSWEEEGRHLVALYHVESITSRRRLAGIDHVDVERRSCKETSTRTHTDTQTLYAAKAVTSGFIFNGESRKKSTFVSVFRFCSRNWITFCSHPTRSPGSTYTKNLFVYGVTPRPPLGEITAYPQTPRWRATKRRRETRKKCRGNRRQEREGKTSYYSAQKLKVILPPNKRPKHGSTRTEIWFELIVFFRYFSRSVRLSVYVTFLASLPVVSAKWTSKVFTIRRNRKLKFNCDLSWQYLAVLYLSHCK